MTKKNYIGVICYYAIEYWESRANAIKFYRQAIDACEGCERERYMNIYLDLIDGKNFAIDEGYPTEKMKMYKFCIENNRYKHFNNPNNTRDFNNKIYYPID